MKPAASPHFELHRGYLVALVALLLALGVTMSRRHDAHPIPLGAPNLHPSALSGVAATPIASAPAAPPVTAAPDFATVLATVHGGLERLRLRQTGDEATRHDVLAALLPLITDANAASIVHALATSELQTAFGTAALLRWLTVDPVAGSAWLASHGGPTDDQAAIIGRSLAAKPLALDQLATALPNGTWKQALLGGAALQAADSDPRTAIAIAQRLPPGADQTNAFETIAYSWAVADPVSASHWIDAIADPSLRRHLLVSGAKALASTDPDIAASWLGPAMPAGQEFADAALTVVDAWSAKNPAAAALWVQQFPSNAPREQAEELVLQRWQKSDAAAATTWLNQLPDRTSIVAHLEAAAAEDAEAKD